jgi:4-hydroxy-tetrahydrodipicolinate synthase
MLAAAMTSTDLTGVYNITPTPFQPSGALDLESLKRLTRFLIDLQVDGLTILGVLGEADKLTDAERDSVIATVLEAAAGEVPICVGATHAGTDGCIAFSRQAQRLGAQAVMVAPPKLARSSDAALFRHYLAVADAVDIPIVIQDHPASSGVFMSVEFLSTMGERAAHCRYVKLEDEPTPPKITEILKANPKTIVFGGLGGIMFVEELTRGAAGTMTGFGFPEILVDIYRRYRAGDHDGARAIFDRFCSLIRFENQPRINLPLRKHVYQLRGAISSDRMRQPAFPLDEGTARDLRELLARLSLLEKVQLKPDTTSIGSVRL